EMSRVSDRGLVRLADSETAKTKRLPRDQLLRANDDSRRRARLVLSFGAMSARVSSTRRLRTPAALGLLAAALAACELSPSEVGPPPPSSAAGAFSAAPGPAPAPALSAQGLRPAPAEVPGWKIDWARGAVFYEA